MGWRRPARTHRWAADGLGLPLAHAEIERELRRGLPATATQEALRTAITLNAKALMERAPDFAFFAGRVLLSFIYEETLDWDILRDGPAALAAAHRAVFPERLRRGVEDGAQDHV